MDEWAIKGERVSVSGFRAIMSSLEKWRRRSRRFDGEHGPWKCHDHHRQHAGPANASGAQTCRTVWGKRRKDRDQAARQWGYWAKAHSDNNEAASGGYPVEWHAPSQGANALANKGMDAHFEDARQQALRSWGLHKVRQHWLYFLSVSCGDEDDGENNWVSGSSTGRRVRGTDRQITDLRHMEPTASALRMGSNTGLQILLAHLLPR